MINKNIMIIRRRIRTRFSQFQAFTFEKRRWTFFCFQAEKTRDVREKRCPRCLTCSSRGSTLHTPTSASASASKDRQPNLLETVLVFWVGGQFCQEVDVGKVMEAVEDRAQHQLKCENYYFVPKIQNLYFWKRSNVRIETSPWEDRTWRPPWSLGQRTAACRWPEQLYLEPNDKWQ